MEMSMYEINSYKYFTRSRQTPEWMRRERYEYCEPYSGKSSAKSGKRAGTLIHTFFSMLVQLF